MKNTNLIVDRRVAGVLAALTAGLLFSSFASAEPAVDPRQLNVVQAPIANLTVADSTAKLDVWLDRPDGLYIPKDKVQLFLRTNRDAYISVFNVNSKGQTTKLFPNNVSGSHLLKAQTVLKLPADGAPYALQVSEPYGGNLIKVVASSTPEPVTGKAVLAKGALFDDVQGSTDDLARQINVVMTEKPKTIIGMSQVVFAVVPSRTPGQPVAAPTPSPEPAPSPIVVTPAAFTLPALTSDFRTDVRVEKTSYKTGDKLSVMVTPERDCELTLVNFDATGKVSVLYPNSVAKTTKLTAGKTAFLPASDGKVALTVGGAPGPQTLLAVCSEQGGFLSNLFKFGDTREVFPTVATGNSTDALFTGGKGKTARASATYVIAP